MKTLKLTALVLMLTAAAGRAQVRNLTASTPSPERKAILTALRGPVSRNVGEPVAFRVEHLKTDGTWAFLRGETVRANGQPVNWAATRAYGDAAREGMFDGGGTAALLHKEKGGWRTVVYDIGPTDVSWGCWWKEHKAPRVLFDLAESNCQ